MASQATPDDFMGRLIKYIPAEIVALFIAVRGIIPSNAPAALMWWIAALSWLLVPLYFWIATTRDGEPPMYRQIIFGSVAFPVWVFAIGGTPTAQWTWYQAHAYIGSVLLIFLTVIFGWLEPKPGS
jgi:hypothetical protein